MWSPSGDSLLFVRERNGNGSAYLLRTKGLTGPLFHLGYSLGSYGHHAWWLGAS